MNAINKAINPNRPSSVLAPPPPPPPDETDAVEVELLFVAGVVVPPELALARELGELPSSPLATTRSAVKLLWFSPTESVTVS